MDNINLNHYKPNFSKLVAYGFIQHNDKYEYNVLLKTKNFQLTFFISLNGIIDSIIRDLAVNEVYTLHLNKSATGAFVGNIRQEYTHILQEILMQCFDINIFKGEQTKKIIHYIRQQYNIELEYLWKKFPDNAVARRLDNQKWFAAILTVKKEKLGLLGEGTIEVLDLKMKPENKITLVDNELYFPGYHMNKDHWFTICLDDRLSDEIIFNKLDESYQLAL